MPGDGPGGPRACTPGRTDGGDPEPPRAGGRSTSTRRRSSTPRAAPGKPKGVVLSHRNLHRRGRERQHLPRQHARRRHPERPAAELRRRTQPGDDGLRGRRALRADELPASARRAQAVRAVRGHRPHLRAAAVAADRRRAVARGGGDARCATSRTPAGGCRAPRSTGCAASSPTADPYLMYGLTEAFRSTYLDPAEVDRRPDSIGKAIPNAEILVLRPDGTPLRAGRGGRTRAPRRSRRARLLERPGAHGRAVPARRSIPDQAWRAPELAVWSGDTVVADEEGFLYFVGRTRRHDQDLRLPGEPDRDRGGGVRHRAGARRRRARRRGRRRWASGSCWSRPRRRAIWTWPR